VAAMKRMAGMWKKISNAFDVVETICWYISALCAALMMVMISSDAVGRYFFNHPIQGVVEIVEEYLMVILVFLALSMTNKTGYHIRVDLLERFIPLRVKRVMNPILQAASFLIILLMMIASWGSFVRAFKSGELSVGMVPYPLWPAYFFVPLGCALLCIRLFKNIVKCFKDDGTGEAEQHSI
jgi:TRAP-type transport system small permease protein